MGNLQKQQTSFPAAEVLEDWFKQSCRDLAQCGSDMFRIWANISLKCISYTVVKTGLRGSQTNCPLSLSPQELKETLQIYLEWSKSSIVG